jgi:hypothetical protein
MNFYWQLILFDLSQILILLLGFILGYLYNIYKRKEFVLKIQEVVLSDFRNLCRYTRDIKGFKPLSKSLLTKAWATSEQEYRDILCEALKYYFDEKTFRKIIREEIKFDDEAKIYHDELQGQLELQLEVVHEQIVENNQETTCSRSLTVL